MTLAIVHRGQPFGRVENTPKSVEAAIRTGAGMVETDVRLTAGGVPALLHDSGLRRIWGRHSERPDLTAAQVAAARGPGDAQIPAPAAASSLAAVSGVQLAVELPAADAGPVPYHLLTSIRILQACLFAGESPRCASTPRTGSPTCKLLFGSTHDLHDQRRDRILRSGSRLLGLVAHCRH